MFLNSESLLLSAATAASLHHVVPVLSRFLLRFEKKVATLLELQIATEEAQTFSWNCPEIAMLKAVKAILKCIQVIRDLLMAYNGDVTQVIELLTS